MQPSKPRPSSPEGKVYGVAACEAVFRHRPADIVRGYFSERTAARFGPLMRFLAGQRRAYHMVGEDELERVAETKHHGGVCLLVRRRRALSLEAFLAQAPEGCVLALEGVGNPHNLGAILRSAAHFGVGAVISPDTDLLQSGAAARTAEGGAEALELVQARAFIPALERLRGAGFTTIATSSHQGGDVYRTALPRNCVILLGEEQRGLSPQAMAKADLLVSIPGSGAVESLNVSVAAGILLSEYARQGQGAAPGKAPRRRPGKPRRTPP